jgi:hypothetical protein
MNAHTPAATRTYLGTEVGFTARLDLIKTGEWVKFVGRTPDGADASMVGWVGALAPADRRMRRFVTTDEGKTHSVRSAQIVEVVEAPHEADREDFTPPAATATHGAPTAPGRNGYPRKDLFHNAAYWTGPVGAPGTHVTGWKRREGARATYFAITCTCDPHRAVSPEITDTSWTEARDELESLAYEHAASHVLRADEVTATPQQIELDAAVQNLAQVLARVIPSTTAHYAVEQTRRALEQLAPRALSVTTHDAR